MAGFTDATGNSWSLVVNGSTIEKVYADTGIDLFEFADCNSDVHQKIQHPRTLVQLLWSLVEEQADKRKVTPRQFGEAMFGDCIIEAQEALQRSVIDFFPSKTRAVLETMVDASRDMRDRAAERLKQIETSGGLRKMTSEMMAKFDQEIDRLVGMATESGEPSSDADSTSSQES